MIQTVSFKERNLDISIHSKSIDTAMNEWLQRNPNIEIKDSKTTYFNHGDLIGTETTLRLIYEKKE